MDRECSTNGENMNAYKLMVGNTKHPLPHYN
jgi:hypothetical protein